MLATLQFRICIFLSPKDFSIRKYNTLISMGNLFSRSKDRSQIKEYLRKNR
jgi:hypothetical protein